MDRPLMPKATAVWLVENTSLTFDQIADFCGLHPLEVKGIADGEVATGVRGLDPVGAGMLTRDEIAEGRGRPEVHSCSWRSRWPATSSRSSARSRATRRSASVRTGRTRSPGCCATIPSWPSSRSASCWAPPRPRCRRCATGRTGRARRSARATRCCWACAQQLELDDAVLRAKIEQGKDQPRRRRPPAGPGTGPQPRRR